MVFEKKKRYTVNSEYEFVEDFVNDLPHIFESEGTSIYKGRNEIKVFDYEGVKLNVKSFKIPNFINKLAYAWLRGSKAKHSYEYGIEILRRGANTPEPIAFVETLKKALFNRSYYVSVHLKYDFTIRDLIGFEFPDKENILKQFATYTYSKLHKMGIHHLDYSRGNVLVTKLENDKYDFSIVDINRLRFEKIDYLKGLRNFAQLWASKYELEIIAKQYAQLNNQDENEAVKLLLQFDKKHKEKIYRKHKFKALIKGKK